MPTLDSNKQNIKKWLANHQLICTSQTTFELLQSYLPENWKYSPLCIGKATEARCASYYGPCDIAQVETQEGVIEALKHYPKSHPFFYPHSAAARSKLKNYLKDKFPNSIELSIYQPNDCLLPSELNVRSFDRIFVSSSSIARAYFKQVDYLHPLECYEAIGEQTQKTISRLWHEKHNSFER